LRISIVTFLELFPLRINLASSKFI
jgi:hypothetical protein